MYLECYYEVCWTGRHGTMCIPLSIQRKLYFAKNTHANPFDDLCLHFCSSTCANAACVVLIRRVERRDFGDCFHGLQRGYLDQPPLLKTHPEKNSNNKEIVLQHTRVEQEQQLWRKPQKRTQ